MKHERLRKAVSIYAEVKNVKDRNDWFYAEFMGKEISWVLKSNNKTEPMYVRVRSLEDKDDPLSDYSAGSFYDTIKHAVISLTEGLRNE